MICYLASFGNMSVYSSVTAWMVCERVWFGQVSLGWISTVLGVAMLLLRSSQVALALH